MSTPWQTSSDAHEAAAACAHHVVTLLEEALAGQDFATFAVSGGSTPRLLFEELVALKFCWDKVHLFWVDERCVPPADPASNFKLADDYLVKPAHLPQKQVHRVYGELPPKAAATRYATEIREFYGLDAGELPHFDVVQQGMGPDGHTASLFPGDPLIEEREGIAAAVFAPQFNQWRVTLLPGPLLAARHTVFLVSGADKAEAVRAVFRDEQNPMKYPAQISSQRGHGVTWFLDSAAAELLE